MRVPTIDVSAFVGGEAGVEARARVVSEVREACERVGFFYVANHGVPPSTLREAMGSARAFFELPLSAKMAVADLRKGYIPVGGCDNAVRPTSLHEKFSCSRVDGVDRADPYYGGDDPNAELYFGEENRWPAEPEGFRAAWEAYYRAMERVVALLHRVFAEALDVPEGPEFFARRSRKHVSNLVALRYPPVAVADDGSSAAPALRVKPHTDPTDVTVLAFERGPRGLQVLPEGEDEWTDVPPPSVEDALLVNLGDVLRFWTNDRWQSTRHRVVGSGGDDGEARAGTGTGTGRGTGTGTGTSAASFVDDRMSLVFFHAPDYDARVDCDDVGGAVVGPDRPRRYPPFICGERSHFAQLKRNEAGLPDRQTLGENGERGE